MAGDAELIEAVRRNTIQVGKLVQAMAGLTEAIRLGAEAQQAMAQTIATVAAMEDAPPIDTTDLGSLGAEPAPAKGIQYLGDRANG